MKKLTISLLTVLLLVVGSSVGTTATFVNGGAVLDSSHVEPLASDSYNAPDAPFGDSFASNANLDGLKVGANSTHLEIVVVGNTTDSGTHLFLDLDPGEGTGYNDSTGSGWFRNFKLGNGFGAEYWAAGWMQNHGDLWNDVPEVIDDNGGKDIAGYTFELVPLAEEKHYYFSYDFLFKGSTPSFAELGIIALTVGGDGSTAYDTIPSQANVPSQNFDDLLVIDEYLFVNITDTSTGALAETPEVGFFGVDTTNFQANGNLTAGNPLEVVFNVWFNEKGASNDTVNFSANTTDAIQIEVDFWDAETEIWTNDTIYKAYKEFGELIGDFGSDDKHVFFLPSTVFSEGDYVVWNATINTDSVAAATNQPESNLDPITGEFGVSPLPPMFVNFVGDISPAGGFVNPAEEIRITAANNLQFEGNTDGAGISDTPAANLPVEVDIVIDWNSTGTFDISEEMTWFNFENNNNFYEYKIPEINKDMTVANFTFFVNVTISETNQDNATLAYGQSSEIFLIVGVEPARQLQYSLSDAEDDLSLLLPAAPASPWDSPGLIDITNFEVLANDFNVEFRLTFSNLTNGFGSGAGFSVVIFSIYLDTGASGGATSTMWNERVTTADGWEYAFKADGFVPEYYVGSDLSAPRTGVFNTGDTTTNQASLVVPIDIIGSQPASDWKYTVLAGSDDFNKFRAAGAEHGGEWQLGGGAEGETDPNVIDMLVPEGAGSDVQDFLLDNYDPNTNTLAEVLSIGEGVTFQEDTTPPTASIEVTADGTSVSDGGTISVTSISISVSVSDAEDAVLSGLASVEIFDGNILVDSFDVSGLTAEISTEITNLGSGEHVIKVLVTDVTGNTGEFTFTITVDTGGDGVPLNVAPFILALVAIPILRRKFS